MMDPDSIYEYEIVTFCQMPEPQYMSVKKGGVITPIAKKPRPFNLGFLWFHYDQIENYSAELEPPL
jgi:hypothetical protein